MFRWLNTHIEEEYGRYKYKTMIYSEKVKITEFDLKQEKLSQTTAFFIFLGWRTGFEPATLRTTI